MRMYKIGKMGEQSYYLSDLVSLNQCCSTFVSSRNLGKSHSFGTPHIPRVKTFSNAIGDIYFVTSF